MPTYAYTCSSCKAALDIFHSIAEEPVKTCPQCGKDALKRGIGGGNAVFQFKGKGYYETDYKGESSSSPSCGCGKKTSCPH